MLFKEYPKIHRLGKEETDGILEGTVTVQEKIDGANVSIWMGDDGIVRCGSRTRELGDDDFRGFTPYVRANDRITEFLYTNPNLRLYGEWLVKHTITYPDEAYNKLYLFDIYNDTDKLYLPQDEVKEIAEHLGVEYPKTFAVDQTLSDTEIKEFVGKTLINGAANGEGVVIKRDGFTNKWGNSVYAKVVHEKFKESNAIVFGGNNKHSDTYWEMYVVNKYCTLGRVRKIMQKLEPELTERLDLKHTPEVTNRAYYDLITEEIWEIVTKVPALDLKKLRSLCNKKFVQIYHDVLNNSLSVADTEE